MPDLLIWEFPTRVKIPRDAAREITQRWSVSLTHWRINCPRLAHKSEFQEKNWSIILIVYLTSLNLENRAEFIVWLVRELCSSESRAAIGHPWQCWETIRTSSQQLSTLKMKVLRKGPREILQVGLLYFLFFSFLFFCFLILFLFCFFQWNPALRSPR